MEAKAISIETTENPPCWTRNPVLVYGPRKAGTTMLLNLLDGGSLAFAYPTELKIKFLLNKLLVKSPGVVEQFYADSLILESEFPNFNKDKYKTLIENLKDTEIDSLRDLMMHDIWCVAQSTNLDRSSFKEWILKEVGGPTTYIINSFKQLFLSAKIILIVRNPMNVTRSIILDRRRKDKRLNFREIFYELMDSIRVYYHQMRYIDDTSVCFVAYENLTKNGMEAELGKLCSFLNIPFLDIHKKTTIFGEPVVTKTSSRKTSEIFINDTKWTNSLSLREKILIYFYNFAINLGMKVTKKQLPKYKLAVETISQRTVS